jgi:dienelactone hydrolase
MRIYINFLLLFFLTSRSEAQQSYNISFTHDGKIVYGTFTKPAGTGKFPTIIINPGSGANNRDGTIALTDGNSACLFPALYGNTLTIYRDLSEVLADSGYAVLRYDKLEYTYPTTLGPITFHKLWLPVETAIKYVKTRSDVDTTQIILIGHSEGSALIPFIAKGRSDVKALISLAGARTPFDSLYAWQLNHLITLLKPCGATAADSTNAANQANQVLSYFNVIRTNTWNGSTPALFGVPASAWYDYVLSTDPVAANYNSDNLPTLFVGMGLDIQVTPAELTRFQNEITITNDFWSMPGLIHYMTPNNDPHVSKALSDTIVYWLRKHHFIQKADTVSTVGIRINNANENLPDVYPNPFNSVISLSIHNRTSNKIAISVSDVVGRIVFHSEDNSLSEEFTKAIDLSTQSTGIYFLDLNIDGRRTVKKIAKE